MLEAFDMEHLTIPTTKVDPIHTEAFSLEILERLAERVVALERDQTKQAKNMDELFEAVVAMQNRPTRKASEAKK
jgi:hypothetical protein